MRLFEGTEFDIPPRCERCHELETDCQCPPLPDLAPVRIAPAKQTATIQIEKRKKGKLVTVVRGLDELDRPEVLEKLKNSCGAGGTIKDQTLEIQGQHAERVRLLLKQLGYRVR
jgi:translation initiation factor 1